MDERECNRCDCTWLTKQACTICMQEGGAVISCADCDTFFHPSCAYLLGYRFGFEFSLVSLQS